MAASDRSAASGKSPGTAQRVIGQQIACPWPSPRLLGAALALRGVGSGGELAFGRGPADPPGAITRLQTCVTPGGSSGVTEQTFVRQLNLERGAELLPSPLITKVKRLIGLIPNSRWECLAVQLQSPTPSEPQQLEQVWKLVGSALARS
jgi:hypothetical protein